jgi:tetratricopeptide (TPR) repeat protein
VNDQDHAQEAQRHLSAAGGYLELGMLGDAADELGKLPPPLRDSREAMGVSALIQLKAGAWERLREVGSHLARNWPEEGNHWIWNAYGTRRCRSLVEAELVLLEALKHHDAEPMIHFNLACYAAQLSRLDDAMARLERAIALDPQCHHLALQDPDLEPLWAVLGKPA